MNCNDVRNAIYVYLDGEFAAPEEADFEHHLGACHSCRRLAEREAAFIRDFKQQLRSPSMPSTLRERVTTCLDAEPLPAFVERRRRRPGLRMAVPAALAAGLAAIIVISVSAAGRADNHFVQEAIAAHQNALPMEVRGSAEQVRDFLQENVGFAVQIPFQDVDGIELVGARLTQFNGRSAVLFNFELGGERLSVLQLSDEETGEESPRIEARNGYRVVTFRDRGLTNSVVGNVGLHEMQRIVPAAFKR